MTQAIATPSIADLLRAIFNRRPALQQPRALNAEERANLQLAHKRLNTLLDHNSLLTDRQFVSGLDEKVLEPLREVVRSAAGTVKEPTHSAIVDVLQWTDCTVASLGEDLIDRRDALDDLENRAAELFLILSGACTRVQS